LRVDLIIKTVISPEAGADAEPNRTLGAVCTARAARATAARSIDAATAARTLQFGWRGAAPPKRGVLLAILDLAFRAEFRCSHILVKVLLYCTRKCWLRVSITDSASCFPQRFDWSGPRPETS